MSAKGRVLIVAGSDSGGGAGIQADIKTVTALGGYAATAITALTAQDTKHVYAVHEVPGEFVARQMAVVLDDIGADCIKTGMLHRLEIIEAVADMIDRKAKGIPLVVDPVMYAKGGAALLDPATADDLKRLLIARADIITPNLPEAAFLTGREVATVADMKRAVEALSALGPRAVLLKGGHLAGDQLTDILYADGQMETLTGPRIATRDTHGTGCTLASAIATGLAQGMTVVDAVVRGRAYVLEAIRNAPSLGAGHGPLGHAHTTRAFTGRSADG